jgi:hypothetical protein
VTPRRHPAQVLAAPRVAAVTLAVAAAMAVAMAVSACSTSGSSSAPATRSDGSAAPAPGVGTDTVIAVPYIHGDRTEVVLDAGTVAALTGLGVTLGKSGAAILDLGAGPGGTISFPITSGYAEVHSDKSARPGYIQGSIQHAGSGLTLTRGASKVRLADFVVDPGNSVLYGTVSTGSSTDDTESGHTVTVPLLDLDGSALTITAGAGTIALSGTVARLTGGAAQALDRAFGTSAITPGTPLGVVRLTASTKGSTQYAASDTAASTLPRLVGESTQVTVDAGTAAALESLHVTITPLGSATAQNGRLTFPITGGFATVHQNMSYRPGWIAGSVVHQGSGLRFSGAGKSLEVRDFVLDPGNSMLSATVGTQPEVPLLFLDGRGVTVSTAGGNVVLDGTRAELTAQAAQALDATFGAGAISAGLLLGTVHLVAKPAG